MYCTLITLGLITAWRRCGIRKTIESTEFETVNLKQALESAEWVSSFSRLMAGPSHTFDAVELTISSRASSYESEGSALSFKSLLRVRHRIRASLLSEAVGYRPSVVEAGV